MSHPSPGIPKAGRHAATRASGAGVGGPPALPPLQTVIAPPTLKVAAVAGGGYYTRGSERGPAAGRPRRAERPRIGIISTHLHMWAPPSPRAPMTHRLDGAGPELARPRVRLLGNQEEKNSLCGCGEVPGRNFGS